jgi:hypothetical protein
VVRYKNLLLTPSSDYVSRILRYAARLLALVCATICGVIFAGAVSQLLLIYYGNNHRLPLFITKSELMQTGAVGLLFVCSCAVFSRLGRKQLKQVLISRAGSDGRRNTCLQFTRWSLEA